MEHLIADDTDDDFDYQPAPLATAAILTFCGVMTMLALYGLADILGRIYAYTAPLLAGN